MRNTITAILIVASIIIVLSGACASDKQVNQPIHKQQVSFIETLPADVKLFVYIPDVSKVKEIYKDHQLNKFLGAKKTKSNEQTDSENKGKDNETPTINLMSIIKQPVKDIWELMNGEFVLALIERQSADSFMPKKTYAILKMDVRTNDNIKLEILMPKITGKKLSEVDSYNLENTDTKIYTVPFQPDTPLYFAILEKMIIWGTHKQIFESSVAQLIGAVPAEANPLTNQPAYKTAYHAIKGDSSLLSVYLDGKGLNLLKNEQESSGLVQKPSEEPATAIGYSMRLNEDRLDHITYFYAPGKKDALYKSVLIPQVVEDKDGLALISKDDSIGLRLVIGYFYSNLITIMMQDSSTIGIGGGVGGGRGRRGGRKKPPEPKQQD